MVYNGPSKGCRRCRNRKIKCDQKRPGCANCSTRGSSCPGYDDIFDKAHRDETVKVSKRNSRKIATALSRVGSSILQPDLIQLSLRIPPVLIPSAESEALGFFFLRYSFCHDVDSTCDIFAILPGMYTKSQACSPLTRATMALALQVTHLHSQGAIPATSYSLYAEAVTSTRKALATLPPQSESDDLLMATLILHAFESTNSTFGGRRNCLFRSHTHLLGAIALLKHRGPLNYRDDLSWRLFLATRNRLLRHTWQIDAELDAVEAVRDIWDGGAGNQPRGPAVVADTLALRLSSLKLLARAAARARVDQYKGPGHSLDGYIDYERLENIATRAIRLASECCTHWQYSIPSAWRPVCTIAMSRQVSGIYEHTDTAIYTNIYVANASNRHRITELGCLSLIGACFSALSMQEEQPQGRQRGLHELPPRLLARAQALVDGICASIPFLTNDVIAVQPTDATALIPSAKQACPVGDIGNCMLPRNTVEHAQQVASSGLYMMYGTLMKALELLEEGFIEYAIRDGQVEWMLGQAHRLRRVLHIVK